MTFFESNRSVRKDYALLLSIHRRRRKNKAFKHQSRYFPLQSIVFFSKPKIICANSQEKVPQFALYRRRQAVEKGMLCFIKHKSKIFVSKFRDFRKEKVAKRGNTISFHKNKWTFLRISSCFVHFLSRFFRIAAPTSWLVFLTLA